MPRTARTIHPGVAMHVVQRGNNRGACFFSDADRLAYLRLLRESGADAECQVHAYCLMTNHVHLLLTPDGADSCAQLMKRVGQLYAQHVNRVHGRTGTLWEGRFRSSIAATEHYVLACHRYIELNPVRAGMVSHPHDYRWSSYRGNAEGREDPLLSPHPAYLALGLDPEGVRDAYRGLFDVSLDSRLLEDIRSASRDGRALGAQRPPRGRPSGKDRDRP